MGYFGNYFGGAETAVAGAPAAIAAGNAPPRLATVYATDEDVAGRAPQDFATLLPRHYRLAHGADGVITAASPWLLASASFNFQAAGVGPNNVVVLSKPLAAFPSGPELFAVDSASGGTLTLRRLGKRLNEGLPPAPAGAAGVEFTVPTYSTQIDDACFDANKFFGINPDVPAYAPGRLYDKRELTQYVVLTVLRRAYIAGDKKKQEDFDLKLNLVTQELADLRDRLQLHWAALGKGDPPSGVMSARFRR